MKTSNRWLGLLGAVVVYSSTSSGFSTSSISGCFDAFFADGDCDANNNRAECGYDSGDCCSCTCVDTENFTCGGFNGFACIDPEATCVDDVDFTAETLEDCGWVYAIGDGYCDQDLNKAECGYDGGDCCSCTCGTDDSWLTTYICLEFACIDPAATCVDDDDITTEIVENCGYARGIGDGYCDQDNNKAECGYDGGDCCSCTCEAADNSWYDDYSCSEFACIDPAATCVDDDDITTEMVENCGSAHGIGNGHCDLDNNKAECGYDGGDCCSCTCTAPETEWYDDDGCSEFACIDPAATCVDDDDITAEMVADCGRLSTFGDGYCQEANNNAGCGYDGGDCCSCTCTPPENEWDDNYACRGFACIDPEATCAEDDDITVDIIENCDYVLGVGDGYCNERNNNALCNYDGGDCCECTCVPREVDDDWGYYQRLGCGGGFACIDPEAECVNDDDITVDMIENCDYVPGVGDGYCDERNNNALCNFDGGDCCECTCVPREVDDDWDYQYPGCGGGFACIDPEAECVNDDDITVDIVANCNSVQVGNGRCDQSNNNPKCGYDGGDCCECTCEDRPNQKCGQYGGYTCIDPEAPCVNDDDITVNMLDLCEFDVGRVGDGFCNQDNNIPECNYDGGDCCECTCEVPETDDDRDDACGQWPGFACIDPNADCVDDDSVTINMIENCNAGEIGNGYCDTSNNNAECGWDGGDCCPCTCENKWGNDWYCSADGSGFDCKDPSASCYGEDPTLLSDDQESMSYEFVDEFVPWEQEGPLPTLEGAVEVGTKTEVSVSATAYDARPGAHGGMSGCGEVEGDGCAPANTRDGISSDIESRWSCAMELVEDEGPCEIDYTFGEPQDIMDIQVAFWNEEERIRTLDVHFDGVRVHTHESYTGSAFDPIGVSGTGITTVALESKDLLPSEWISILEVLIFVTP